MQYQLKTLSDLELCALLKSEGQTRDAAFTEIYNRYSNRVFLYCRRIIGDEDKANDIFQDTFVRFLKAASGDRSMTNVPAYLLRIARNLSLNVKRNQKNTIAIEDFEHPVEDRSVETAELASLVAMALDLLPEEQREALALQTYGGLSYEEIAETMEMPVTSVRNWIARGKKRMREILTPYLAEEDDKERRKEIHL
jgi:RNA polymerase sigma-70 factor (ECF subfamily)